MLARRKKRRKAVWLSASHFWLSLLLLAAQAETNFSSDTSTRFGFIALANSAQVSANSTNKLAVKLAAPMARPANKRTNQKAAFARNKQYTDEQLDSSTGDSQQVQISITPRLAQMRVPVESNSILKCLISMQSSKFNRRFEVRWSRFMYDENVYEQLDQLPVETSQSPFAELQPVSEVSSEELLGKPVNRQKQLRDFLARSRQETSPISELLMEATLAISPVMASDNASYYCTASNGTDEQNRARIDLITLARPQVQLTRLQPARDSRSAIVHWLVHSDGNTPIKKTILMVRNDTLASSTRDLVNAADQQQLSSMITDSDHHQWQRIDIAADGEQLEANVEQLVGADVDVTSLAEAQPESGQQANWWRSKEKRNSRQRRYNLTQLLPGVSYNLRLAAINDMGQSNWSYLSAMMPNDVPAQIGEMFLLSRSNDSLAIGWRRPSFDNAKTIRYEMQLFDLNRTLTLDANTNTSASAVRTNFMYIFVNLNPGTDYHFHVRACSKLGCSSFSEPKLLASTLDGEADEPIEVELSCQLDAAKLSISWLPPANPRGQLTNYSVAVDSFARYLNASNLWATDEWRTSLETSDNRTLSLEANNLLVPNTNYSVRVCANNRSKHCGRLSAVSTRTQCSSPAELPQDIPVEARISTRIIQLESEPKKVESLQLEMPFVSQRNGTIDCIQLVLIRLPSSYQSNASKLSDFLPADPNDIKLNSYLDSPAINRNDTNDKAFAYLAEELDPSKARVEDQSAGFQVILGDGEQQNCQSAALRELNATLGKLQLFDGALQPLTFYTGFLRLLLVRQSSKQVARSKRLASTRELLVRHSHYLKPIKTGELMLQPSHNFLATSRADDQSWTIDSKMSLPEMARRVGQSLWRSLSKLYSSGSAFVGEHAKLDSLGNYIMRSSPLMQLLEVGVLVLFLSLLLLLIIYMISLPGSRRRRRKMRRQNQLKQQSESAAQQALIGGSNLDMQNSAQNQLYLQQHQQQAEHQLGYQQVDSSTVEMQMYKPRSVECPIHSSPSMAHQVPVAHLCANQDYAMQDYGTIEAHSNYLNGFSGQDESWREQYERNCRTTRRLNSSNNNNQSKTLTLSQQSSIVAMAKKINKSIPLRLFNAVLELRLRHGWLEEEFEQLPREPLQQDSSKSTTCSWIPLRPQLIVSRNDQLSALISGNDNYPASLLTFRASQQQQDRRIVCAKSPLDADSVWDFWRLVYELEVSTLVMLTQVEDLQSGELKCAQYWPTNDNEETTILSPCNEYVQKSTCRPAKFKIRQETLEGQEEFRVRRLTLMVLASKPGENDEQTADNKQLDEDQAEDDDQELLIVERSIIQLQFLHWNTSNVANQTRLLSFIETANERHLSELASSDCPMLVHCSNGLARSGVFAAMSFVLDELEVKFALELDQSQVQRLNLFQLVSRLRCQREMLLSPYRFYQLLYQLTGSCIARRLALKGNQQSSCMMINK